MRNPYSLEHVVGELGLELEAAAPEREVPRSAIAEDGVVHEGGRNEALSREAFRLIKQGVAFEAIYPVISAMNEAICSPPLDDAEVRAIAAGKEKVKSERAEVLEAFEDLGPAAELVPAALPVPAGESAMAIAVRDALRTPMDIDREALLRPEYLVKGWLDRASNAVLFGEWNAGKTFVVLNLAVHVAAGARWFYCRVNQAPVLYLTYEGQRGIDKRIAAIREQYPELDWESLAFAWQVLRHPLTTKEGREALQRAVKQFYERYCTVPGLIVIDPLMDALGGNDADPELMARLNMVVLGLIGTYGCAVIRVHHTGHADKTRSRGHSSLPASADTEIWVTEDTISAKKQRDNLKGELSFRRKVVELGVDQDGDPVTTCIIEPGEKTRHERKPGGEHQQVVWKVLCELADLGGEANLNEVIDKAVEKTIRNPEWKKDRRRGRVTEALQSLQANGWIDVDGGKVILK